MELLKLFPSKYSWIKWYKENNGHNINDNIKSINLYKTRVNPINNIDLKTLSPNVFEDIEYNVSYKSWAIILEILSIIAMFIPFLIMIINLFSNTDININYALGSLLVLLFIMPIWIWIIMNKSLRIIGNFYDIKFPVKKIFTNLLSIITLFYVAEISLILSTLRYNSNTNFVELMTIIIAICTIWPMMLGVNTHLESYLQTYEYLVRGRNDMCITFKNSKNSSIEKDQELEKEVKDLKSQIYKGTNISSNNNNRSKILINHSK